MRPSAWLSLSHSDTGPPIQSLTEAKALIEALRIQLATIASQTGYFTAQDLVRHNATANRSRNLTLQSLQQQHANPSLLSLQSTFTLDTAIVAPSILTLGSAVPHSLVIGRYFNVQNLCRNARRYRDNTHTFEELTRPVEGRPHRAWACTYCGAELSRVNQPLAPPPAPPADRLWINAAGMLQAHCHAGGGDPDDAVAVGAPPGGWACIWPVRDADACGSPFAGEHELLEHMRRWHVKLRGVGNTQAAAVDWTADGVWRSARECGFGVEVGGRGMREGRDNFVVPAAVRA
jgi:hypothetical protein